MRSEQEVFSELAVLCSSPGYVHAIAFFCFRDNIIGFSGEMKPEDMQHLFSRNRLIRTETSTLIGLMLKSEIDYTIPSPQSFAHFIEKTESLLEEIHMSMSGDVAGMFKKAMEDKDFNPFTAGSMLREPIFYGGESAYSFQYRDFSPRKYGNDNEWLKANKGFSILEARDVVYAISKFQDQKCISTMAAIRKNQPDSLPYLTGYEFTVQEIAEKSNIDSTVVQKILLAFSVPQGDRNDQFSTINDFNIANAYPLLSVSEDIFILFHIYSLVEALYETPYYWMGADAAYVSTAMENRGVFTEEFSAERLRLVFGKENVHLNVDIFKSENNQVGEIDVLVIFGNRAIVLQAKSKRLTIDSKKGNDRQIRDDFKKGIQKSYNQGLSCAKLISNKAFILKDANAKEIVIPMPLKEIYILCVISDHYPALSFQARQFLEAETTETLPPPFVLDVFTLDAMTEMLQTPLQLLSYIERRTKYSDKLMASHELTILSYHLKQNLWLNDEYDTFLLTDEISADLDLAMMVRRDNIPGNPTPDGILTRFVSTTFGIFVKQIESRPDPATIDLGFMLLTIGEQSVREATKAIDILLARSRKDGNNHDLTLGLGVGGTGFTVHCNDDPIHIAHPRLHAHCEMRKYTERAQTWFGICINPKDSSLRFGVNLNYKWEHTDNMHELTQGLAKSGNLHELLKKPVTNIVKLGRNDICPCGSGKKYKKCCLH